MQQPYSPAGRSGAKQSRSKQQHTSRASTKASRHPHASQTALHCEPSPQRRALIALIAAYLQDHEGGNHSPKTLEWHRTALGLMRTYFEHEHAITQIDDVEDQHISSWFTHMRKTKATNGKVRCERTIQTYARSARAFFHWLEHRGILDVNPFDRVVFPKVGRPLIQTITPDELEALLHACVSPQETGPIAERAAVRNRAILWVLYDAGIRVSELTALRVDDLDRKRGVITVLGKGSKERRIALGQNCLRHLLYYLDTHRPGEEELAEWGNAGEAHLFLSETRRPLTKNGVELLFKRLKTRAGITGKRVSPHILRHTFAINYLIKSNDPFSLQELLGHEDMTTVKLYMHMNDTTIQDQKRKYSPGDHFSTRVPESRETRRRGFQTRDQ